MLKPLLSAAIFVALFGLQDVSFAGERTKGKGEPWIGYEDGKNAYQVSYPSGSHFTANRDDYVRIQNYEPTDNMELKKGQYYLEIRVDAFSTSCKDWFEEYKPIRLGKTKALIGTAPLEGDPGGIPFVLCVARGKRFFVAVATENHPRGPIANRILQSIRFSK